jgi:hypothetical protein
MAERQQPDPEMMQLIMAALQAGAGGGPAPQPPRIPVGPAQPVEQGFDPIGTAGGGIEELIAAIMGGAAQGPAGPAGPAPAVPPPPPPPGIIEMLMYMLSGGPPSQDFLLDTPSAQTARRG